MIPLEKVQQIVSTYETLEKELASGDINKKDFANKSKGYSSIREVINQARSYLSFKKEQADAKLILVPRHPERFDKVASMIASMIKSRDFSWQRYSENEMMQSMNETGNIFYDEMMSRLQNMEDTLIDIKNGLLDEENINELFRSIHLKANSKRL